MFRVLGIAAGRLVFPVSWPIGLVNGAPPTTRRRANMRCDLTTHKVRRAHVNLSLLLPQGLATVLFLFIVEATLRAPSRTQAWTTPTRRAESLGQTVGLGRPPRNRPPSLFLASSSYLEVRGDEGGDHCVVDVARCARHPFTIRTLHESDRLLVIDKPPGIAHHSRRHDEDLVLSSDEAETGDAGTPGEASVSPGILALLRDQQAAGRIEYQGRLYGVHRLDQVTSGILVLAKDADMSRRLTQEFREGRVVKYYTGLSTHKAKKKQGWVKGRMVRGRRKSWYLTRNEVTNGGGVANLAVTRFFTSGLGAANEHLLVRPGNGDEPFTLPHLPPPRTLLLFRPYTGRTHQLRVAAKSVGLPLAGDPLYRDNGQDCGHRRPSPMAGRTYLHATALRVPEVGLVVISPPPFGHLWDSMGNELFRQQLSGLVQKHCDDEVISEVLLQHLGSTALDDG